MNVIEVDFTPKFRSEVFGLVKRLGLAPTEILLTTEFNQSFIKVLLKSIISKEGW